MRFKCILTMHVFITTVGAAQPSPGLADAYPRLLRVVEVSPPNSPDHKERFTFAPRKCESNDSQATRYSSSPRSTVVVGSEKPNSVLGVDFRISPSPKVRSCAELPNSSPKVTFGQKQITTLPTYSPQVIAFINELKELFKQSQYFAYIHKNLLENYARNGAPEWASTASIIYNLRQTIHTYATLYKKVPETLSSNCVHPQTEINNIELEIMKLLDKTNNAPCFLQKVQKELDHSLTRITRSAIVICESITQDDKYLYCTASWAIDSDRYSSDCRRQPKDRTCWFGIDYIADSIFDWIYSWF